MRCSHLPLVLLAGLLGCLAPARATGAERPTPEQVRFFETRIRPLLADHCYQCHGPAKHKGGLRLDSREAMLRGGDSGTAVLVPGRPQASLLIRAVGHQDEALRMPPRQTLTGRQVADLTRWVEMGAPYPETATAGANEQGRTWWAFRPPADPPVPAVQDAAWARTPLDRFVLARLEAHGLRPAPPADRPHADPPGDLRPDRPAPHPQGG
jgi:hypothetical protein